ncbi:MAG TPA: thermonuclease family protein [Methylotenera sp.]|nr:thermonuclease family protein [Methylotenera sp.]HPH06400.1 thermonuclease family protein [Methylotenera sp.]HPN01824.1 thermonuclease family protein [Methylotenera sp.]
MLLYDLSDMVYGRYVDIDWHKQDHYGRVVGKVLVNGVDVNLEQVHRGMAWFYRKYQKELVVEDRLAYHQAEEYAQNNAVGLWLDAEVIAPWDFRKRKKQH